MTNILLGNTRLHSVSTLSLTLIGSLHQHWFERHLYLNLIDLFFAWGNVYISPETTNRSFRKIICLGRRLIISTVPLGFELIKISFWLRNKASYKCVCEAHTKSAAKVCPFTRFTWLKWILLRWLGTSSYRWEDWVLVVGLCEWIFCLLRVVTSPLCTIYRFLDTYTFFFISPAFSC